MRSKAGMANRQGDVELRFAQFDVPIQHFDLAWLPAFPIEACCLLSNGPQPVNVEVFNSIA